MKLAIYTRGADVKSSGRLGYPVFQSVDQAPKPGRHWSVLRWGRSDGEREFFNVLNPATSIERNINKLAALRHLDSHGVRTPLVAQEGSKIAGGTWILRPVEHAGGNGYSIVRFLEPRVVPAGMMAIEALSPTEEWRVWFVRNIFRKGRRIPINFEQQEEARKEYPCRSKWGYTDINELDEDTLFDWVNRARKALCIDVGAADVLLFQGKYYVLEINTAPAVDTEALATFYRKALECYGYEH